MLKPIKTIKEVEELKVGDLLQVINTRDKNYKNIAVIVRFDQRHGFCLYNITKPGKDIYIHVSNFECWGRLLPNAKTTKNP